MLVRFLQFTPVITIKRICWATALGLVTGIGGEFLKFTIWMYAPILLFIIWFCYSVHWTQVPIPSLKERWLMWRAEGEKLREELDRLNK